MDKRRENFDKKEALLQAALLEFSENSFKEASLNTILSNAGVSKGAFYYAFRDKKDLYVYLVKYVSEIKKNYCIEKSQSMTFVPPEDMTIFDYLRSLTSVGVSFCYVHPVMFNLLEKFVAEDEAFQREVLGADSVNANSNIKPMIDAALDRGDFDQRYPREFAEKLIYYLLTHYFELMGFESGDTEEELEQKLHLIFEFMEHGLGNKN